MKTCTRCKKEKETSLYSKAKKGKDGLSSICKLCRKEQNQKLYANLSVERKRKYQDRVNLWQKNNREKLRAITRKCKNARYKVLRQCLLDYYGNKCTCCGEVTKEFLTIEHLNNNGSLQRKKQGLVGVTFYRWVIKQGFPPDLTILCFNCNCSKGIYGKCPHQQVKEEQDAI